MARRSILCLAIFLLGLRATASAAADPDPAGLWDRADGQSQIRIEPCGEKLCAVNTWIGDPSSSEKVGDTLVMTLMPESDTELDGEAYDKRRDMTYSMHITVQQPNLSTRGCVLAGLLCKTAHWTRAP